jgi:hypothetical protein
MTDRLIEKAYDGWELRGNLVICLAKGAFWYGPGLFATYTFITEGFDPHKALHWFFFFFGLSWAALGSFYLFTALTQYIAEGRNIQAGDVTRKTRPDDRTRARERAEFKKRMAKLKKG